MSALNIALTVIMSYFFIRGIFRGLVKEVVGILGLFVAFWAASAYWQLGSEQLKPLTDNDTYRGVLSYVIIYMVIYFLVGLLSLFVDKIVKLTITPLASSLAGALLGILKGGFLCLILLTATTAFLKPDNLFYEDSEAWKHIEPICASIKGWLPSKLKDLMEEKGPSFRGNLRSDPPPANQDSQRPAILPTPVDYNSLMRILEENSERISPAWREKLQSLSGPEALSPEDLKRFIREHPELFSAPSAGQASAPGLSWPRPAEQ
jgi:membrane protein required for colicin V production